MSEILEKMLISAFGLLSLLIVIPIIMPLFNSYYKINDENMDSIKIIKEDLEILEININKYINGSYKNSISNNFKFSGDINIFYQNSMNNSYLHFNFYYNPEKSPIFGKLSINSSIDVNIESMVIRSYLFYIQNNSVFLIFR